MISNQTCVLNLNNNQWKNYLIDLSNVFNSDELVEREMTFNPNDSTKCGNIIIMPNAKL